MNKLLKVELQGFLKDRLTAARAVMADAGYIATGANLLNLAEVTSTCGKMSKNVTLAEIDICFHKIETLVTAAGGWKQSHVREEEEEPQERLFDASLLPYIAIAHEHIIDKTNVSTQNELLRLTSQLSDSVFTNLCARDLHTRRHEMNYALTDGHDYIQLPEIKMSDFVERFKVAMHHEVENAFPAMSYYERSLNEEGEQLYKERTKWRRFFLSDAVIMSGLEDNIIPSEWLEYANIRSPKFSKALYQKFGEKSVIVRMFNDRPKKEDFAKMEATVIEGRKVILSNLSHHVMKMTYGNHFSSCQDYSEASEHLLSLPASVRDETMSIAYICNENEDDDCPDMDGRILIKTMEYKGKLFFVGWNGYGDYATIIDTLKTVYGNRFIFERDIYQDTPENMFKYEHEHDTEFTIHAEIGSGSCECYLCEGSGEVEVAVVGDGYRFHTECPRCEGSGEDEEEEDFYSGDHCPYVNGWAVSYNWRGDSSTVYVPLQVLEAAFQKELNIDIADVA